MGERYSWPRATPEKLIDYGLRKRMLTGVWAHQCRICCIPGIIGHYSPCDTLVKDCLCGSEKYVFENPNKLTLPDISMLLDMEKIHE